MAIPGKAGRRFVDLLSGLELKTSRSGGADELELALPADEAAIVGIFPRTIHATPTAGGMKYSSPPGMRLEAYEPRTNKVLVFGNSEMVVGRDAGQVCVRAARRLSGAGPPPGRDATTVTPRLAGHDERRAPMPSAP